MTFADNLDHDLATVFLDTTVFAGTVTYRPAGAGTLSVAGVFQPDTTTEFDSGRGRSVVRTGVLTVSAVDVATVTRDDTVTINNELWSVVTFVKELGAWTLQIQRSEGVERTASKMIAGRL